MKMLQNKFLIAISLTTLLFAVACNKSFDQEATEAKADLNKVVEDLEDAADDALETIEIEWQKAKSGYEGRIDDNELILAGYKTGLTDSNGKIEAKLEREVKDLEWKNKQLKTKLRNYKSDGISEWEEFQNEVDHDFDELGKKIKELTGTK